MNVHIDKTQDSKSQSIAKNQKQRSSPSSTSSFIDNRTEAAEQKALKEIAQNSSRTSHLEAKQYMADNSHYSNQVIQLFPMTNADMRGSGFKDMKRQRWQYNEPGTRYHVSAIRKSGDVSTFHVVGRWKGKKPAPGEHRVPIMNRIDYDEGPNNTWTEVQTQLDKPEHLAEMRAIAHETVGYFGGTIV